MGNVPIFQTRPKIYLFLFYCKALRSHASACHLVWVGASDASCYFRVGVTCCCRSRTRHSLHGSWPAHRFEAGLRQVNRLVQTLPILRKRRTVDRKAPPKAAGLYARHHSNVAVCSCVTGSFMLRRQLPTTFAEKSD